jgi:hypothetical protein
MVKIMSLEAGLDHVFVKPVSAPSYTYLMGGA